MTVAEVPRFVLASASPRRKSLLEEAGYSFDVVVGDVDEPRGDGFPDPRAYVAHAAWVKGSAVARSTGRITLSADTVASIDGSILGKPIDRDDAKRILDRLMNTVHQTMTGVCLFLPEQDVVLSTVVVSDVKMRRLDDDQLTRYLDGGSWRGKAGAYGIQDKGDPFIDIVRGSISNVIGLPLERLAELFTQSEAVRRATKSSG